MRADAGASPVVATRPGHVLLLLLALGAGVVDAVSLTTLGVFTAAVTANLVLVGLALGDADSHAAVSAALAFAGFAVGVLVAARVLRGGRRTEPRLSRTGMLLGGIAVLQTVFLAAWLASDGRPHGLTRDLLAGVSALAMGGQTAAAGVWHPGIPPTYVSGMLTGLLSEVAQSAGRTPNRLVRVGVIVAIVAGAALGGVMIVHARGSVPVVPLALTTVVAIGSAKLQLS